jgi:hypothetical protein
MINEKPLRNEGLFIIYTLKVALKISESLCKKAVYIVQLLLYNKNVNKTQINQTEVIKMKLKAYSSQCIGIMITGFHYYGEIVKTNKKSIRVTSTVS